MPSRRTKLPVVAASVIGREGGGKSRFMFTMPKPLSVLSVDPNTEYVLDQMVKAGDIEADSVKLLYVPMPAISFNEREDIKDEAKAQWEEIIEFLTPMVNDKASRPRSLGLDTGTELYTLRQLMTFGKTDQISPETRRNMMGPVNRAYAGIIETFRTKGVNVCVLHRSKDLWQDKTVRRGSQIEDTREKMMGPFDQERDGFKYTGNITNVEVVVAHDSSRSDKLAGQFGMRVVRCGHRPILANKAYWGREKQADESRVSRASFPYLAVQMFPGTSLEDWQ